MSETNHMVAWRNDWGRHLVRSSTPGALHLAAGGITCDLAKDAQAWHEWGTTFRKTSSAPPVSTGFTAISNTSSNAGEQSVADQLEAAVRTDSKSSWTEDEWPSGGNYSSPVFFYFSGGMSISGKYYPWIDRGYYAESYMMVIAYHFTLPEQYRNAGYAVKKARVRFKGLGSYAHASFTNLGYDIFRPAHEWESDWKCGGNTLMAKTWPDSQSIGIHIVHGATLSRATFPPSRCFYVYGTCPTCGQSFSYEYRNLLHSFYRKNNRLPTNEELKNIFYVDMEDPRNAHWKLWGFEGSRSYSSLSSRYEAERYAFSHGGRTALRNWFIESGGNSPAVTYAIPYIGGSTAHDPDDTSFLWQNIELSDADAEAFRSSGGVWVIVHALPLLNRNCYTSGSVHHGHGGSYLPSASVEWENGPWQGAQNSSSVGRYGGGMEQSIESFDLRVTLR